MMGGTFADEKVDEHSEGDTDRTEQTQKNEYEPTKVDVHWGVWEWAGQEPWIEVEPDSGRRPYSGLGGRGRPRPRLALPQRGRAG